MKDQCSTAAWEKLMLLWRDWHSLELRTHFFWLFNCCQWDAHWSFRRRALKKTKKKTLQICCRIYQKEMSGTQWSFVFAGDNYLWALTWRFPRCFYSSCFKRLEYHDGIWPTFSSRFFFYFLKNNKKTSTLWLFICCFQP